MREGKQAPVVLALLVSAMAFLACSSTDVETQSVVQHQTASTTLTFDGVVPSDGLDHFFIPFEVPPGTVEIEVRHDDRSEANILDWGLNDASGFRGWGGGTTEPTIVNADAASDGYLRGPIKPGQWRVVAGKAKIVNSPATYHVEVELRTAPTLKAQTERKPYVPRVLKQEARWYAGDFHVHSRDSTDASPAVRQIADFARSRRLDFVEVSDHNVITGQDYFADAQDAHPDLLLIPGVEFTTYAGHANGIGATRWVDHKIGQPGVTIDGAADQFAAQGALFSINHPVLDLDVCIGCAWKHNLDGSKIAAVEIASLGQQHGGVFMFPGAMQFWDSLCAKGHHVAAIGGSDDHEGGAGEGMLYSPMGDPVTMVFATELSAAGILEGIRKNRTVVKLQGPADPMVDLTSELVDGSYHLRAKVTDLAGSDRVTVRFVKNNRATPPVSVTSEGFTHESIVTPPDQGEDRYRVEVLVANRIRTVTSNVFVKR